MQIRRISTIHKPPRKINVRGICWSENNRRLAVGDANGVIHLFDETGVRKDSFQTKSSRGVKGGKSYMITDLCFSPDSVKLAVSLSDGVINVYRLGLEWGEKKSICNRFSQPKSTILGMCWPSKHPLKLVFGNDDGDVKMGYLQNQSSKTVLLYRTNSPLVSFCPSPDGHGFISGHYDGSIHRFYFQSNDGDYAMFTGHTKICVHPILPTCLGWGETLIVGGPHRKILYLTIDGTILQQMDFSKFGDESGFNSISVNESGQCFVLGGYNSLRVFNFNMRRNIWEEGEKLEVQNLYSVVSQSWKPDGSKLVIGNSVGVVEFFDTCIKRYRHKKRFEFTFVTPSQVIVKIIDTGARIVLKSLFGCEILKLYTKGSKYLIGHTSSTLLLGDLGSCKLSEVQWSTTGREKFFFDNPNVCLVHSGSDFYVIEYGINDVTGSFRTSHISPDLISVRILHRFAKKEGGRTNSKKAVKKMKRRKDSDETDDDDDDDDDDSEYEEDYQEEEEEEDPYNSEETNGKYVAYLSDSHTIRVENMNYSGEERERAVVRNPDSKINWLELSYRATKLLYRDMAGNLYLYDLLPDGDTNKKPKKRKITLLTFCSYVQWVPNSDVVVAQNRGDLCVWYSINSPDRATIVPINGDVESIVRMNNQTAVIVNEGNSTINYGLNEGLIQFGSAVEMREYEEACAILDELDLTPETEAMWKNLAQLVMRDGKYHIAERAYAAIGDVAKQKYLSKITRLAMTIIEESEEDMGLDDAYQDWRVRARIAALNRDFQLAEQIYVEQGEVGLAMKMYEELHMFEESIELAIRQKVPDAQERKNKYLEWLIKYKLREKAAKIFEKDGHLRMAIDQYIKGGFPAAAAGVVERNRNNGEHQKVIDERVLDTISAKLVGSGMHEKAGVFYEKRQMFEKALQCYREGHAYHHAVELCAKYFPEEVIGLEEEWGDYLCEIQQMDMAIHHYLQSRKYKKAVEAAVKSRQWVKVQPILDALDEDEAKKYYVLIAQHYERLENFGKAREFYMSAGEYEYCMGMFKKNGMLEDALSVAEQFLPAETVSKLYVDEANTLATKFQKYTEAERLFVKAKKPGHALEMYRKLNLHEDMIRVVRTHLPPKQLSATLVQIALQFESAQKLAEAESYYIEAGEWKTAVTMYKNHDQYADALRVAKLSGDEEYVHEVLVQWATILGEQESPEAGAQLLFRYECWYDAIQFALDRDLFDFAFRIASSQCPEKVPDVHRAYAYYLEEEGKFAEAEEQYIHATMPKEAIDMYIHQHDWENAKRVANSFNSQEYVQYVSISENDFLRSGGGVEVVSSSKNKNRIKVIHPHDNNSNGNNDFMMINVDGEEEEEEQEDQEEIKKDDDDHITRIKIKSKKKSNNNDRNPPKKKELNFGNDVENVILTYCKKKKFEQVQKILREEPSKVETHLKVLFCESYFIHLVSNKQEYDLALNVLIENDCYPIANDTFIQNVCFCAKMICWKISTFNPTTEKGDLEEQDKYNYYLKISTKLHACFVKLDFEFYKRNGNSGSNETFQKWNQIVHLNWMKWKTMRIPGLKRVFRKICISNLRYCNELRPDQLFFEAGNEINKFNRLKSKRQSKQQQGEEEEEYGDLENIFYNRIWDIYDVMDELIEHDEEESDSDENNSESATKEAQSNNEFYYNQTKNLENTDFKDTDIPSKNIFIPKQRYCDDEQMEEIEGRVLVEVVSSGKKPKKPVFSCERCSHKMYFGSLKCMKCMAEYPPCVITGFPVLKFQKVECTSCHRGVANRKDWNDYLMNTKSGSVGCPYCGQLQLTK